jgi:hypothetical protein
MRRLGLVLALAVASSTVAASVARADDPPQPADVSVARDLFREASRLADEGQWAEAANRYERSLALKRAPITLYSLGITYQHLGRLVDAIEMLRAFLVEPSVEATKPYEQPSRDAIAEMEPKLGFAVVRVSDVPGLSVTIDGKAVPPASLGLKRPVDPGAHEVVARAAGYIASERAFTIAPGGSVEVDLSLEPAPSAPGVEAPRPIESAPTPMAPTAEQRHAPTHSTTAPWAMVVAGGGVFAVGLIVGVVGIVEAGDAPSRHSDEADAALAKTIAGDVLGGVGLATAGAGAIWLIVDAVRARSGAANATRAWPSTLTMSPWIGPDVKGALAGLEF